MKFWSGWQFPKCFRCPQCSINILLVYCGSHGVQPVHFSRWQHPCWLWQERTVLVNADTIHPQIWTVTVEMMRQASCSEVLGDNSTPYITATLYWGYWIVLCVSCSVVVWTCFVMCTCIYRVLYCLYCVFVLFRLCIFILICLLL